MIMKVIYTLLPSRKTQNLKQTEAQPKKRLLLPLDAPSLSSDPAPSKS